MMEKKVVPMEIWGAFSAHPLKNLNACGDGGFVVTNNKKLFNYIKLKRNHGHVSREKNKIFLELFLDLTQSRL